MTNKYLSLDERPEKKFVSILMVIFGILCMGTAAWWAIFLLRSPEQSNSFWAATIFLLLFGVYQVYAGLGLARRYIKIDDKTIQIRQNFLLPPRSFNPEEIENITIRAADIVFKNNNGSKYKLKLGIRYPDLGENIKKELISYGENQKIDILYSYDIKQ